MPVREDAAPQPVTRLEEALALAYEGNPNLLAQRGVLRSTDALYPGARSAYGPQVNLEGRHQFAWDRTQQQSGNYAAIDGFASTAALVFTQPLFSFGRRFASEQSALAQIDLGRNQLRLAEAQTMFTVIRDYVFLVRDRAVADISTENLELLDRQLSASAARFKVREVTSTDLQQVETRVAVGRAQLLNAQGGVGASESRFLQSVGALPGTLAPPPPLDPGVATLDEAYAIAEAESALIRAASAREKASRAELAAARAEQYPSVSLQSSGAYGTVTPYSNSRRTTELRSAIVVGIPLVDGGNRRARIEGAEQANDADWRLLDAALRDTRQSVAEAWNNWRAAGQSVEHFRMAAKAARKAYDGAVIQEKAGARTTLDVLDLARDLLNVRTSYVSAMANEYLARASLLAAMGRLEAPLLLPDIRRYDPEGNFRNQRWRGDLPLITTILSGIDSIPVRDLETDRAYRDAAADLRSGNTVPAAQP
ncbi:TolC family outer membrane protein [Novosphingobium sp. 17-62-19]|uniref:TolC family outer membrane protein n=1 Tax=Novosphingobium sp. 17-62-19 TaxID=1970406 RepID=UPI0025E798C0|nr:TolC family outer membrane protein [Novosphingobium sp. 17-62-19]HQS95297.1 TolC family outer membrane protein [Novosphingobium sp.]